MHVVQIRDWIGLFLKLRKSRSLKIGGGVEARLTCNTCSLPFQRALYSSLSNHFPLFEYVRPFSAYSFSETGLLKIGQLRLYNYIRWKKVIRYS